MDAKPTTEEEQAAHALGAAILRFLLAREDGWCRRRPPSTLQEEPQRPHHTRDARGERPLRLLLTAREAARAMSISERTLWSLTSPRGEIPAVRLGSAVRYALADLEAWVRTAKRK